jgi:O-methyltransferase
MTTLISCLEPHNSSLPHIFAAMKLFLIRYTKILFIRLRLHVIFDLFSGAASNLYHLTKLSAWAAKYGKIELNDFPSKWDYNKRFKLYEQILQKENLNDASINYFEFGVAGGHSFRWFQQNNSNPESRFFGFDTFTGLPEDWGPYKKGTFSQGDTLPAMHDDRGNFFEGLFQQTLPGFLSSFQNDKRKIIMMDADLYSSTLFVLSSLAPFLKAGDIIFFDEFAVPTHEFKAFKDFTESFYK